MSGGGQALKDRSDKKFTFFEKINFDSLDLIILPSKKGFSVAEAMITLLIVSVALAAMAPMMTKKMKTSTSGDCKWIYTINGTDINRRGGKVGIGLGTLANPGAKLEIRGENEIVVSVSAPENTNSNILEIKKGDKRLAYMTPEGYFIINDAVDIINSETPAWNPLTTYASPGAANWRNALQRDGGIYINSTSNHTVWSVTQGGKQTSWINSDGSSSFAGVPKGTIVLWSGGFDNIPSGWALCNGQNGTPDLRNRFVVGAGWNYSPGQTGGADWVTLTVEQMPSHNHGVMEYAGRGSESRNHITSATNDWSSGQTTYAGGNQAHENRPPFYALAYIMKL